MSADTALPTATWEIRVPTAPPKVDAGAPTYTIDKPLAGLKVGLRHEGSWRSWMTIVAEWEQFLTRDGAQPVVLKAGGRVGVDGLQTRADVEAWAKEIDCGISGLGTCGSCTSNSVHDAVTLEQQAKPAIVAVCDEFAQHGRNMARFLGHAELKQLVLPYPLEALPQEDLKRIAVEFYPQFLDLLGVKA
jgi:hypothetical protein